MTPDTAEAIASLYNVGRAFERDPMTAEKPAQTAYRLAEDTLMALVPAKLCAIVVADLAVRRLHRYLVESDVLDAIATANAKTGGKHVDVKAPREAFASIQAALGHR